MTARTPINLVLGSGGARGLTHIGVIRVLLEQGYEIRSITGCSMGALVGALHVTGHMDAYEAWVTQLTRWDVLRFLDLSQIGRAGMVNGDKLVERLSDWLGGVSIESLPIPFTVVAADIVARKEIWITSGDLLEAVRASIAVPGVFTPLVKHGRVLVDGGILNPLPIPPARLDNSVITVAVSLSGREVAHPFGDADPGKGARLRSPAVDQGKQPEAPAASRGRIDGFLDSMQRFFGRSEQDREEVDDRLDEEPLSSPALTDVMLGMFGTMQDTLARHQLAGNPPDLLIDIPCNICQSHEFHRARALIDAGAYWARRGLQEGPR
jgi:NTE family protein